MTFRITQAMLDSAIERLNETTKRQFVQNDAYGYSQLAISLPNSTGISTMSLGNTKKELYYQIHFALEVLSKMENQEYDMAKCKHEDRNYNNEVSSLIRDYGTKGKKYCISCHKEFDK
jgi:hypothetical protein